MLAAEELPEAAERPERVDLERAWLDRSTRFRHGGDEVVVRILVPAARREALVATALAVGAEETDDDGVVCLELTFQDARHAEWATWEAGADAEVLSPTWLRAALHDRAAAIVARYADAVTAGEDRTPPVVTVGAWQSPWRTPTT